MPHQIDMYSNHDFLRFLKEQHQFLEWSKNNLKDNEQYIVDQILLLEELIKLAEKITCVEESSRYKYIYKVIVSISNQRDVDRSYEYIEYKSE